MTNAEIFDRFLRTAMREMTVDEREYMAQVLEATRRLADEEAAHLVRLRNAGIGGERAAKLLDANQKIAQFTERRIAMLRDEEAAK